MSGTDRFAAKARDVLMRLDVGDRDPVEVVAAALAAAHNEAIEMAEDAASSFVREQDSMPFKAVSAAMRDRIRALRAPEGKT